MPSSISVTWLSSAASAWHRKMRYEIGSFVSRCNPNLEGVPAWKPYTAENGELMEIGGDELRIHHNHDRKLAEIIDRHCFKQLDEFRKTHK